VKSAKKKRKRGSPSLSLVFKVQAQRAFGWFFLISLLGKASHCAVQWMEGTPRNLNTFDETSSRKESNKNLSSFASNDTTAEGFFPRSPWQRNVNQKICHKGARREREKESGTAPAVDEEENFSQIRKFR
jgi:hypothetical protein